MFRYYSLSTVCYAYLRDVPTPAGVRLPAFNQWFSDRHSDAVLGKSVWYSRGWTLQELIAPGLVLFLSDSWDIIGSKYDLSRDVELICGVPQDVLRHKRALSDVSVAQRMSWAANRTTTRVEDEAYCLLGIFNINMPTLYGEGKKAFRRLQEEIIRTYPDTTIYAWGRPMSWDKWTHTDPSRIVPTSLIASSPSNFRHCGKYSCAPVAEVSIHT